VSSLPPFVANKPLSSLCTLGIGGPAHLFATASTIDAMQALLAFCSAKNLPYLLLGKGSNTLFDDKGFDGLVIQNQIDFCNEVSPGQFHVGAGHSFSLFGARMARRGWTGLEFAAGIPGTVGGAVFMNAGANGSETADALISVDFISDQGQRRRIQRESLDFAYRFSSFHEKSGAIVAATFQLTASPTARKKQKEIMQYRLQTQPYGQKSAGCMFQNPSSESAGALIDRSGLKGLRVGGVRISTLHANFLINEGNGSAKEATQLMQMVQKRVKQTSGIDLHPEMQIIPFRRCG